MIPRQAFGRTGHESTRTIFGAAALGEVTQERGRPHARGAAAATASTTSTRRRATATPSCASARGWRATATDFFLATKTGERTYAGRARRAPPLAGAPAASTSVDLIQLHNLVDPDEWDDGHGAGRRAGGAGRGARQGLVRFIGVTGHGMHRRRHAPAQPASASTSTPCCCPTTSRMMQNAALRRRLRGAAGAVPRAQRGGADDQVDRARPVGRPTSRRAPPGTSR